MPWFLDVGVIVLVVMTGALALFVLLMIWRDGYARGWRSARSTPPKCLRCGYNLSGLTQCRCPECGSEFRIDELWRTHLAARRKV